MRPIKKKIFGKGDSSNRVVARGFGWCWCLELSVACYEEAGLGLTFFQKG